MTQDEDKTVVLSSGGGGLPSAQTAHSGIEAPTAKLMCIDPSQIKDTPADFEIDLDPANDEYIVGRDPECSAHIDSRKLSRKHARVFPGTGRWGVEDMNSTNGVFVNGRRTSNAWLKHGDEVKFGPVAFEFTLDRPDLTASAAPAAAADAGGGDDDDAEKTMMFGSGKSSEVFLQAAREAEEAEEKEAEKKSVESNQAAAHSASQGGAQKKGGAGKFVALAVVGALIAGGIVYYPIMKKQQRIDNLLVKSNKATSRIIDTTREQSGAQIFAADHEKDLIVLTKVSERVNQTLEEFAGNLALSNDAAKVEFLKFEREFASAFEEKNMRKARRLANNVIKRGEEIAEGLGGKASSDKAEDVRTIIDLGKMANILVEFREWTEQYPRVSDISVSFTSPMAMGIQKMEDLKDEFIKYRRSYNKALSVTYVIFKKMVDNTEKRDITVLDSWTSYFASTGIGIGD